MRRAAETRFERLAALVGAPYAPGAGGPEAFDCYGLARHVLAEIYGVRPLGPAPLDGDWRGVMIAARRGLRRIEHPVDGALVIAGSAAIGTHVGVVVATPAQPARILHAIEGAGVVCDTLHRFAFRGFNTVSFFAPR